MLEGDMVCAYQGCRMVCYRVPGFAVATIRYVGEFRMQQLAQDKQIEALIARISG